MSKITTILFLIISLASCSPKIAGVNTVIKETITTDTVYVPKEKIITLPGDSVTIYEAIPCPDVVLNKEATSKNGHLKAVINIVKGVLRIDCKTDSLVQRIQWLEAHSKQVVTIEKTQTITLPPKRWIPKWVWWLLGLNIVYVAAKVLLKVYKIPIRI